MRIRLKGFGRQRKWPDLHRSIVAGSRNPEQKWQFGRHSAKDNRHGRQKSAKSADAADIPDGSVGPTEARGVPDTQSPRGQTAGSHRTASAAPTHTLHGDCLGIHSPDDPAARTFGPWPFRAVRQSMPTARAVTYTDQKIGIRFQIKVREGSTRIARTAGVRAGVRGVRDELRRVLAGARLASRPVGLGVPAVALARSHYVSHRRVRAKSGDSAMAR